VGLPQTSVQSIMRTMINRSVSAVALAVGFATAGSVPLHAAILDLTGSTSSGTVNGGFFTRTDNQSTGTGVIDPFVRLSGGSLIEGYNATARPVMPDVNTSPQFTRDLKLSQIPIVTNPSGQTGTFYEFLLDINQTSANPKISLYEIELYTAGTALSTANTYAALTGAATKKWDLDSGPPNTDGDSRIELDYSLNAGSGSGDLFAYIPVSAFAGVPTDNYLYLFSAFGDPTVNNDGFEEWAVRTPTPVDRPGVPDGGTTAILLGTTLLGLAFMQKRMLA
jgi:hypothetical protein